MCKIFDYRIRFILRLYCCLIDRVVPLEFIPKLSAANNSTLVFSQSSLFIACVQKNQFMSSHLNIVN